MKKLISIFLILSPILLLGQKAKVLNYQEVDQKLLHFGFSLGLNTANFGFTRSVENYNQYKIYPDLTKLQPGFNVHIVSELRLHKYFGLRCLPGLTFVQRDLIFIKKLNPNEPYYKHQIESNFIDFPLLIKYKSERINNYRPYILLGASARYDLASRKREFNESKESDIYKEIILLKPFDGYFEIGVGVDSYLQYFKFSTELKLAVGIRNVKSDKTNSGLEAENMSIDKLQSYLIILAFNFE